MNRFPKFVKSLGMSCMGEHIIEPSVGDCSIAENSDLLKLSLYLLKCEIVYERNKVTPEDALITELDNGHRFMFHMNHVCVWYNERKKGQVPMPLSENSIWIAAIALGGIPNKHVSPWI